eukprot:Sdes_comp18937_c0_seq1m9426
MLSRINFRFIERGFCSLIKKPQHEIDFGDFLIFRLKKNQLVKVTRDSILDLRSSSLGIVKHEAMVGKPYYGSVTSSFNRNVYYHRASLSDYSSLMKKTAATINPSDCAFLAKMLDAGPGMRI